MNANPARGYGITKKFFLTLWGSGPLLTIKRVNEYLQDQIDEASGLKGLFRFVDRFLCNFQRYLDGSFDRKHGTSTSGITQLKDLTINKKNLIDSIWYEPMSVKTFRRIMKHLSIDFSKFEFLDLGSGKGRVLLLASEYGYKKIIGVEFARELHLVAVDNIKKYNNLKQKPRNIQSVWMDAADFPIPDEPVVIFLFSPFKGKVMEKVLENVSKSFSLNPREFVLIFYGSNPDTINHLKTTKFLWREIGIYRDWSQFTQCRFFISNSQE